MARNSVGRFEPGRGGGGLVHVRFDARQMIQLANRVRGEAAKIDAATRAAHVELAEALQDRIATALETSVAGRGRQQRDKPVRLADAIRSQRNRQVNAQGFTVGYLDSIAEVRPYYRGLEVGTRVHVNRYLSGVFSGSGADGGAPELVAHGVDAQFVQTRRFRYNRPFTPGIRIRNPIPGYHYFSRGVAQFTSSGGTTTKALAAYKRAFKSNGMDLMARGLTTGKTVLPGRSGDAGLDGPELTGRAGG